MNDNKTSLLIGVIVKHKNKTIREIGMTDEKDD